MRKIFHFIGSAFIYTFIFLLNTGILFSQSLPIVIDSQFDDWTAEAIEITDATGDGDNIDLLRFEVANDENHLFLQIEVKDEFGLTEGHKLTLHLDTDLNPNTGTSLNGIGVDLEVRLGEREAFYKLPSGQGFMSLNDLIFRHQPTVTNTVFEISLDLSALSNAGFSLFNANGVSIVWKDETGQSGDVMPENGIVFTYLFDDSPSQQLELIELEKENQSAIRLLSWNTLNTGLDDFDRKPIFDKIVGLLMPDIVTFNECWDMNASQVATFMNASVPLGNFQNWNAVKLDQGNVTASRYPILQSWSIFPGHRLTASLIDIPNNIDSFDLLVINAHFRCCDNDYQRQLEADAFVQFILDAKTPGGIIDLPEFTPFVLSGDLNLVGEQQQLTTLLTGEIVNTGQFGQGGPMNSNGSDLQDVISRHSDDRLAYTWRNDFSSFPPSRIDYHITSEYLQVENTFTLETSSMSQARLNQYGLQSFDVAAASDHLPKVVDLSMILEPLATTDDAFALDLIVSPNPNPGYFSLDFGIKNSQEIDFYLFDPTGRTIISWQESFTHGQHSIGFDISQQAPGIYFLKMKTKNGIAISKIIKL